MTASMLRVVLIITLVLVAGIVVGGFYFAQSKLSEYASNISQLNADASAGDGNVATLKDLKKQLSANDGVINRTQSIVADSKSYAYQDQIIDDIVAIGKTAGIKVTSFTFDNGAASAPGTVAAPTPAPTTSPAAPTVNGIKSTTANITIDSPATYSNILAFIKGVELNPTKMQIARVSLEKETGDKVTSPTFAIEVYIR